MHGPTGSSGVQRAPNSRHSRGAILPHITSPHRQGLGLPSAVLHGEFLLGVKLCKLVSQCKPARINRAEAVP